MVPEAGMVPEADTAQAGTASDGVDAEWSHPGDGGDGGTRARVGTVRHGQEWRRWDTGESRNAAVYCVTRYGSQTRWTPSSNGICGSHPVASRIREMSAQVS